VVAPRKTVDITAEEVATTIENFLNGLGGRWDWDDFISFPIADPRLDQVRARCNTLSTEFPPTERGHYCGPKGLEIMRALVRGLRKPGNQRDL
jgi:hypothetical protein